MKRSLHIRRAVEKGYGPAREHTFDPKEDRCTVCGIGHAAHVDRPVDCFPKFGGEEPAARRKN